MGWRKHFTAIFILLILVSTFVAVAHHHDNTVDDHDCPICLVSHHQYATGQTVVAFDGVPFFSETAYVISASIVVENIFTSFQSDRAPPA
jgi:hypothetical protein